MARKRTAATATPPQTIDEAIEQELDLGHKNPLLIAQNLIKHRGEDWIRDALWSQAEVIIRRMVAERMRARTRAQEAMVMGGGINAAKATSELKLETYWVPEIGRMAAKDMGPQHFRLRASYYFAEAATRATIGQWNEQVADTLEAAGGITLGEYTGELPTTPANADRETLAIAASHTMKEAA